MAFTFEEQETNQRVFVITPQVFGDSRGYLRRLLGSRFCNSWYSDRVRSG